MRWNGRRRLNNSTWAAPPALRSSLGRIFGQFKGYAIKSLENLMTLLSELPGEVPWARGKRAAKFVAAKGAIGGIKAGGYLAKLAGGYLLVRIMAEASKRRGVDQDTAQ
jgi:hypothetical protein